MVCTKCEARFTNETYCPGCGLPTAVNAIDDETWNEAKNNAEPIKPPRSRFGFSFFLLVVMVLMLLAVINVVVITIMTK